MPPSQALLNECCKVVGNNMAEGVNLYLVITRARRGARLELYNQESTRSFDILWKSHFDRLRHKQTPFTDTDFKLINMRNLNGPDAWFTRLVEFCEAHGLIAVRNSMREVCIQPADRDPKDLRRHLMAEYDEADHKAFTALARFLEYPRLTESEYRDILGEDAHERFVSRDIHLVMDTGATVPIVTFRYMTKKSVNAAGVLRAEAVDAVMRGLVLPDGRRVLRCEAVDLPPE